MSDEMVDVIAVNIATGKVRFMAQNKTERNAYAIVNMAVMRRGVDEEFFVTVEAGKFKEGDSYSSNAGGEGREPAGGNR